MRNLCLLLAFFMAMAIADDVRLRYEKSSPRIESYGWSILIQPSQEKFKALEAYRLERDEVHTNMDLDRAFREALQVAAKQLQEAQQHQQTCEEKLNRATKIRY